MPRTRPVILWIGALSGLVLLALVSLMAYQRATASAFDDLQMRAFNTLNLAESSLRGQLARFERLPQLLADQRAIRSLVLAPDAAHLVDAANRYLRDTAELLGASDIYVMYRDGVTLAASNFDQPHSFVGGNFSFRPYFLDAMEHGAGRFYALGTTSNKRGYYFGAPIVVAGVTRGVLVIKIDVDEIEQAWASDELRIIVTDPEDIVFLSNRPDWLFRAFAPLTPERLARTAETRRYAAAEVGEITHSRETDARGFRLLSTAAEESGVSEYLVVKALMPDADWTVQVLISTRGARAQAATRVAVGVLVVGLVGLMTLIFWQRRRQLAERLAVQQAAKAELERRVVERTSQLGAANAALKEEVTERRVTEKRLRQTQAELVQAGKLAALGQMSAALSHEFNQPLAAARNYAENAQLLLQRKRGDEAQENIGRILGTIDRMGRISRHLRSFARKSNERLQAVPLSEVALAAQELLGWRLQKSGATLLVDLGNPPPVVTGGAVRLQQVLVNLIGNALDAVEGQADKRLHLTARPSDEMVEVSLRDYGPGVPEHLHARIFDPFFSTKEVGKGLGLGLSISYNIMRDFDGSLSVRNHPEGGAEFVLRLHPASSTPAQAAE